MGTIIASLVPEDVPGSMCGIRNSPGKALRSTNNKEQAEINEPQRREKSQREGGEKWGEQVKKRFKMGGVPRFLKG